MHPELQTLCVRLQSHAYVKHWSHETVYSHWYMLSGTLSDCPIRLPNLDKHDKTKCIAVQSVPLFDASYTNRK